MLNLFDCFSGIGGFSYGLELTGGFNTVAFCEVDPHCRKVLKKHWPTVPCFEDVNDLVCTEDYIEGIKEKIDIMAFGFPCQDISVANVNGKGLDGRKSGLWRVAVKTIEALKPRWLLIENVPNLRTRGLAQVIQDLWSLGYVGEWNILPAAEFGAPHLRERLFIVAQKAPKFQRMVESKSGTQTLTHPHHYRLRPPFAPEKKEQEWRTEATSRFSNLFGQIPKIEPRICGSHHGFSAGLDQGRRRRIKQCGNAVVPAVVYYLGLSILYHEGQINERYN